MIRRRMLKIIRPYKPMSDSFLFKNDLKQGDALSPLIFNFALEYAIAKI
jgi:hypothetical protein